MSGGGKETPRQKMIGMMYLVLTALLALNVSSSILKSFLIVNDSMLTTNANFERKVEALHQLFDKAYLNNKDKTQAYYDKSKEAKRLTEEFKEYVKNIQIELIAAAEGVTLEEAAKLSTHDIKRQDNYDTPSMLFIEQGRGKELREHIVAFKKAMLSLLPEEKHNRISTGMDVDGPFQDASGATVDWETQNFYQAIIVGACTILNKLENDAMNLEYDVVDELLKSVSEDDFSFDNVVPRVVAKSNYVLMGETYEAELFIVAYDSKSKVSATVNGANIMGENGIVTIRRPATTEGLQTIFGKLHVPGAKGVESYDFKTEYTVARPAATVSADAMNVFYVGVDNPVSVAAAGAPIENIVPSISNGSISRVSPGKYIVRVNSPGKTVITVSSNEGGSNKSLGSFEYRVKRVPDPIALVNGIDDDVSIIDKSILANSEGLVARLKDFEFKLDLKVNSFSMQTGRGGDMIEFKSTNNRFTDEMISAIRQARRGQKIFFDQIQCQMPTGRTTLRAIVLTIK